MSKVKPERVVELTPSRDIQRVDADRLSRDPKNVRKKYPQEGLEELGASIREEGVMQNLECDTAGVVHMGNRRLVAITTIVIPELNEAIANIEPYEWTPEWKTLNGIEDPEATLAALYAKLADIRAVPVRVLTNEESKDKKIRQVIENLQREDVTAVDEADGYADLLAMQDEAGNARFTIEAIAQRIGKGRTRQYVYNRLKLLRAPQDILDAVAAGKIPVRTAERVGRVPHEKDREELAKKILKPRYGTGTLPDDEVEKLIKSEYVLSLAKAPFDRADEGLVSGVGACAGCQFRTGNDPALSAEMQSRGGKSGNAAGLSPDLCTSPACFRAKADAAWQLEAERAKEAGYQIMSDEDAKKAFAWNGDLVYNTPWVDLDDRPDWDALGTFDDKGLPKWRALLKESGIKVTKARNPHKAKIHELVKRTEAKEAIRLMLAKVQTQPDAAPQGDAAKRAVELFDRKARDEADAKKRAAKQRDEDRVKKRLAVGAVDALLDKMTAGTPVHLPVAVLQMTLEIVLDGSSDACGWFAHWSELEKPHAGASGRDYLPTIMDKIRTRKPAYSERDLCALISMASVAGGVKYAGVACKDFKKLCAAAGLDLEATEKWLKKEIADEDREKKKAKGVKEKAPEAPKPETGLAADVKVIRGLCAGDVSFASKTYTEIAEMLKWPMKRTKAAFEKMDAEDIESPVQSVVKSEDIPFLANENAFAPQNELLLIKAEQKLWGDIAPPEGIDHGWIVSKIGISDPALRVQFWRELTARGIVDGSGDVKKKPLGWSHDAVGNRRANDYYEAMIAAGEKISIAEVEVRFALKNKALATYRKNQNRQAQGNGGAEG
jgi:ParB-like chromosome segregation protein Spo0J